MIPQPTLQRTPARSLLRRIYQKFERIYKKQIDGTGLALFRVVFCTVQLAEILHLFYFRHLIYDVVPFVQPYEIDLAIPLLAWAGTTVLLVMGLFTRPAAIANYLFTLLFLATAKSFTYHMFVVYQCLGLLFMFLPVAQCLSVDRLLLKLKYSNTRFRYQPARTVSQLAYYVPVVVGIAFVYLDSTLFKLVSPMWLKGLGMWVPASLPFVTHANTSFLLDNEVLVKFMGYLSMVFEFLFLFLFSIRRYRAILMVIGIGLHLGILLEFPIPLFAIGFGSLYLLMVPVGFWRRLFAREAPHPKLTFYYDGECPLCARTRVVIEHLDLGKAVRFRSVQHYAAQEPALDGIGEEMLLDDIHSVDRWGRVYAGIDTYAQVFNAIAYLKPVSWLIRTPGIYQLGKAVYAFIARNRTTERCTEDNCGYVPPVLPPNDADFKIFQGVSWQDVKIRAVAVGLGLLIGFQCLTSYNAPLIHALRRRSGLENTLPGRAVAHLSQAASGFGKTFLGITNHDVFLDYHFATYQRIVAVTYTNAQGVEQFLPITRESGQPGPYTYGALWCKWAYNVVGPHPDQARLEQGIRDFTAFWGVKHGLDLTNCRFKVKVKRIAAATEWRAGFLEEQLRQPWQDAGEVEWHARQFTSRLNPITSF